MAAQAVESIFFQGDDQERADYVPAGTAVVNGEVVDMGGDCGCCTSPEGIAIGATGSLATHGVFKIKKAEGTGVVFAQGADVFWDTVARTAVVAAGANIIRLGKAAYAAVTGDNHVKTKINEDSIQS